MTRTCGTCEQWQIIDVGQLVERPEDKHRPDDIGRCRSFSVERYRREAPLGVSCHRPVPLKQAYGQERKA